VAAAREVFTEVGYEAATFQAIAVRADQTLSARHCHPDATERPYFALMFRAGRRVHGRWQCPRCSTCLARGRRSIRRPRCVNLEDATWQEVVGVVVGQDVLRGNLRRCIGAISDSERHAASMTRRCHSGKSPTEPASSMWSGADAVVDVGAGAGVCFGSGLVDRCRGWGSARSGRRRALDSTVLNDAVATQGHDHPARGVLASASRPLPAPGARHTRVGRRS
jgi:Bacterial regulatory proteins, tetR family